MAKQQPKGKKPAPRKSGGTMMQMANSRGSYNNPVMLPNVTVSGKKPSPTYGKMLEEVVVKAKPPVKASRPELKVNTTSVSDAIKSLPKIQNQSIKKDSSATGGKKMGRGMTALSDATSYYRGAANLAFGKNKSKTTGGKILERVARVGAAAMGVGYAPTDIASNYASTIARNTDKATGYIKNGTIPAAKEAALNGAGMVALGTVVAPAIAGQINFNKRSEESKKRGIWNPGKGRANLGINFDKPFEKTKGRDVPLPDSSSLFND